MKDTFIKEIIDLKDQKIKKEKDFFVNDYPTYNYSGRIYCLVNDIDSEIYKRISEYYFNRKEIIPYYEINAEKFRISSIDDMYSSDKERFNGINKSVKEKFFVDNIENRINDYYGNLESALKSIFSQDDIDALRNVFEKSKKIIASVDLIPKNIVLKQNIFGGHFRKEIEEYSAQLNASWDKIDELIKKYIEDNQEKIALQLQKDWNSAIWDVKDEYIKYLSECFYIYDINYNFIKDVFDRGVDRQFKADNINLLSKNINMTAVTIVAGSIGSATMLSGGVVAVAGLGGAALTFNPVGLLVVVAAMTALGFLGKDKICKFIDDNIPEPAVKTVKSMIEDINKPVKLMRDFLKPLNRQRSIDELDKVQNFF
ncbi:MAG: hypothetical protein FWF00_03950 [Endomicrobia bacterium]|nr:hypothetical protein [Endomicrobiia bacterium]MCL2506824.1 hypothetical protein [Endomicrobiia bacterium]